jgi:hypothetical protein
MPIGFWLFKEDEVLSSFFPGNTMLGYRHTAKNVQYIRGMLLIPNCR